MNKQETENKKHEQFWQRIALIAGAFSFVICILLIVNYAQINRADPINTEIINSLVERLNQNPADEELREEIRALDLLARKAFFTNQWQIRAGGYLLLIGIAIVIIAFQVILANRKKQPVISDGEKQGLLQKQKITRRWVSIGGVSVVATALVFAYLSHQSLEQKFSLASAGELPQSENVDDPGLNEQVNVQESFEEVNKGEKVIDQPEKVIETEAADEMEVETILPDGIEEVTATSAPDHFANFRGPGGNGITDQKNIPTQWNGQTGENVVWKVPIPLDGFNSPIIWGDKLFLSGAEDEKREVYCINRLNGEFLWTVSVDNVPGSPSKGPEVANYTGHAAPSMTTDGKGVYAIFSNGDIVGLDFEGNTKWAKNVGVPDNHYGHSSSLLIHNNKVIVQYDQKNITQVMALSAASGETVWSKDRDVKVSWASPIIVNTGNRDELILAAEPFIISYNPDSGEELWRVDCIYGEVGPSAAYADGVVFVLNDYSKLSAIRLGVTPEIIWEDEEYLSDIPSPVATKDYLIVPTSYGIIVCYDAKTGEKYWEHEIDNTIYASPLLTGDNVYLVDKQGIMYIFKVDKEFRLVSQPELGEKIVCTPAFADGKIYLRGYDNLFCIGN